MVGASYVEKMTQLFRPALFFIGGVALAAPLGQPTTLTAHVERNVTTYPGRPAVRVTVSRSATYAGGDRFILKELSDCEMHVFVEADANRRIRRFYWVHLETYLPSRAHEHMTYGDIDRRFKAWGQTIWIRTEPANTSRTAQPGSDTAHFRNIIRRAGYTLPPAMMTARLVRLLDDPRDTGYGRRELMIIYGEDLALARLSYDDVVSNDQPNVRWTVLEKPLLDRALRSVRMSVR